MSIGGNWDRRLLSRRRFLGAAGGLAGLLAVGSLPTEKAVAAPRFSDYPFKLGVASGDPRPDSVVLWTRLAPEPLAEDGSGGVAPERYDVRWEVAADENFRKVVRRGSATAGSGLGHSVHAGAGGLRPGREYFYRFKAGGEISAVGRTKTAPAFDVRLWPSRSSRARTGATASTRPTGTWRRRTSTSSCTSGTTSTRAATPTTG